MTTCGCPICAAFGRLGNKAAVARDLGLPRSTVFDHLDAQGLVVKQPPAFDLDGFIAAIRCHLDEAGIRAGAAGVRESGPPTPDAVPATMPTAQPSPPSPGSSSRVLNPGGGLVDHSGPGGVVLGLFDLHLPWVNARAFDAIEAYAHDLKPSLLLLGGDALDCHTISKHDHDNFRRFQEEIDESRPYLERLARLAPRVVYLEGNHESRCARLARETPALEDLRALELPHAAGLSESWAYYDSQTHYRIGGPEGVIFLHGDVSGGPKTATGIAHKLRTRLASSVVFGHFHADQIAPYTVDYRGEIEREGHAVGWLGDTRKAAGYVSSPNWQTSFITAYFGTDPGDWCIEHHPWKRGAFRINGKKYS